MSDQVSPLGSLGAGSSVLPLPAAKTLAVPANASPASSRTANVIAASADPADAGTNQAAAGNAPSGKAAKVDAQKMNAQLQVANSSLQFKVDQSTGISYFKVVDSNGQVVRQVPSAEVLAMAQKLQDFANHQNPSGILMDQEG